MSKQPLLIVNNLEKQYTRGFFKKEITFSLKADFVIDAPAIIGIMGANGAGKTTMFEMITGTTSPTSGQVICGGQDIHNVKYHERDRLAIHYHQSYQVRNIQWTKPAIFMASSTSDYPLVHLFDEPQFNTQDGYIHFMVDFFQRLRAEGRIVFISVHPTEIYQLQIVENICEHFMFVADGKVSRYPDWETFTQQQTVRDYLGDILINYETP